MSAIEQDAPAAVHAFAHGGDPAELAQARQGAGRIEILPLAVSLLGIVVALATTLANQTDLAMAPLLLLLGAAVGLAVIVRRVRVGVIDWPGVVIAVMSLVAGVVVLLVPVWTYGYDINGIVHRTVVSGPALLVLSTAAAAHSIRRMFVASPSRQDLALAPVFVVPILLGIIGFVIILGSITVDGLKTFRLDMITTAWGPIEGTDQVAIGYLNNILGTFLLLALTLLFALLPGIGAGVFMSEYPGRVASTIAFCTTMLRAVAIFIIGATAVGLVRMASGLDSDSFLSMLIRGGWDDGTRIQAQKGSFVLAAVFLAFLVLPVIARMTEEGLRSVPREMREGSVALGATDGFGLRRILLPWAAPNILTGIVLAGAEAAGGLAVIWFMAGTGERGVGLFSGVTDLDFAVFAAKYGPRDYAFNAVPEFQMIQYQSTAALLLMVLTISLTLIAMVLQRRFARRYRGSITA